MSFYAEFYHMPPSKVLKEPWVIFNAFYAYAVKATNARNQELARVGR